MLYKTVTNLCIISTKNVAFIVDICDKKLIKKYALIWQFARVLCGVCSPQRLWERP